jgi:hypothetical protein
MQMGFGGGGSFPDLAGHILHRHESANAITIEYRLEGTFAEDFGPVKAHGRRVCVPTFAIYEFDADGMLTSERAVADLTALMA